MSIFSKHLANEGAGRGVRINFVTPAEVLAERLECRMPGGAKRQAAASVPPGRMGHRRPCRRLCTSYRRRRPRSWASPSTLMVASRSLDPRRWKVQVAYRSSYYRESLSQENSETPTHAPRAGSLPVGSAGRAPTADRTSSKRSSSLRTSRVKGIPAGRGRLSDTGESCLASMGSRLFPQTSGDHP